MLLTGVAVWKTQQTPTPVVHAARTHTIPARVSLHQAIFPQAPLTDEQRRLALHRLTARHAMITSLMAAPPDSHAHAMGATRRTQLVDDAAVFFKQRRR